MWLPKGSKFYNFDNFELKTGITINREEVFPYLDLGLFWNDRGELKFQVYMKENQKLKYLNKGSCHTSSNIKNVAKSVFKRLTKLTSMCARTKEKRIDEIYPQHATALKNAGLHTGEFSKFKEFLIQNQHSSSPSSNSNSSNNVGRNYFENNINTNTCTDDISKNFRSNNSPSIKKIPKDSSANKPMFNDHCSLDFNKHKRTIG